MPVIYNKISLLSGVGKMKINLKTALLSILLVFLFSSMVNAEMYKWVDEKGVIHFQDYPPNLSPSVKVEKLSGEQLRFDNYIEQGAKSDGKKPYESVLKEDAKNKRQGKKRYARNQSVELYVTSWCGYCKKAKAFLRARKIDFTEYDVEKDKDAARRHRKLNPRGGVPVAVINGKTLFGFSQTAYESALKKL